MTPIRQGIFWKEVSGKRPTAITWKSLNSVQSVRAHHITRLMHKTRKPLHELCPDSEALTLFLNLPLTQTEIKQFYQRNLRWAGNHKALHSGKI